MDSNGEARPLAAFKSAGAEELAAALSPEEAAAEVAAQAAMEERLLAALAVRSCLCPIHHV